MDWEEQMKKDTENAQQTIKDLLPELKKLKVAEVYISYNGSGDEGSYESAIFSQEATEEDEAPTAGIEVLESLHDKVQGAMETIVNNTYGGGWWDNDGATGNVKLKVETGEILIDHNWYVTNTESDAKTITL